MPLKILFLTHAFYPDVGGIEVNAEILAQAFQEVGHDVRMITWSDDLDHKKFPYAVIRNPGKLALLKEHAWADVVFENNPCLRLAWPNIIFNKPLVIALNTWVTRSDGAIGVQDKLKLAWFRRAKGMIAVSDALRNRCWPAATVIGNPYRTQVFSISPAITRNRDFVFLGRLVSDKGADLAILALHQLIISAAATHTPTPTLTIIGQGPEKEKLEKLATDLNIQDQVHFTGVLRGEALNECLNQHRFLLVPSLWEEPFGNVVLEGMACGCIPIVADSGGLPDAVGKAGLTFARGNVDDMLAAIQTVMQDTTLEQRLQTEAKAHLQAHHPNKVASQYLQVLEAAVADSF